MKGKQVSAANTKPESSDFSLVLGGPLYQLYRKANLSGSALELLRRRVVIIAFLAWVPPLLLSLYQGHAFGDAVHITFLRDVEAHARFLVALPALLIAELVVHRRIGPLVRMFVDRKIVTTEDLPAFNAAVESALRVRNSVAVEIGLLILVYTIGIWTWLNQIAVGATTWYAQPGGTGLHLTLAGYWYAFVSIPIFQFILLRWYMRFLIWFQFLWRTSRLNLHLTAAHPDRAGGIGFLGSSAYAFGPILFAQGAVLSGLIASRVLYEGQDLISFKMEAFGLIAAMVLFILGPLTMFTPRMERARRKGAIEYGVLANRYVFKFEGKWIQNGAQETEELLGAADIQSLADLGNSYSVVTDMRLVPFGVKHITQLAAATAAPLIPLTLTIFSVEELVGRLLKILI